MGDWDAVQAKADKLKPCDYCGRTGETKARATRGDETRLFCHGGPWSCYNACRGRYFESCTCDKVSDRGLADEYERWFITRRDPICRLHISPESV